MSKQLTIVSDVVNILGEGPCWSKYGFAWVDILGKKICHVQEGQLDEFHLEQMPSSLAFDEDGGLVFTLNDGFYKFEGRDPKPLCLLDRPHEDMRFNDGKIDGQGRYWSGTMDMKEENPLGSLYVMDDSSLIKVLDDITVSNGLCWDGSTFYYVDSPTKQVKKFYYDSDALALIEEDVLFAVTEEDVFPDGMCIDDEGHLWLALWNGFKVLRIHSVSGEILEQIDLPCKKVTSCCFGGNNRDELYITTASYEMSPKDWEKYPDSGKIFMCRPGVTGPLLNLFQS
ncbi:SMP-30/gluconolactonase/LRE family protein [Lentisphaera profundi]|uniref:SMP-30/gluconolactonase/LRE family protein n=1 Tax=Lentisphaera profundi TaxID=1658616 RepID=A0ABY7VQ97_9BACT|nr:SMP-30/gluconolactonase/LRE family protein [Lentisphaera profundi]WDE95887.1 SMP-30/gluconolactonase/LRE family protein [Lentisphaera profundi]